MQNRVIGAGGVRRFAVVVGAAFAMASGLVATGAGEAAAAQTRYFECPVTVAGAGCGISGNVGPGKYLAEFKFATSDGYDFEPYVDQCDTTCPVFHWAVGRGDRTPAGFQITSDGPFILERMLTR